LVPAEQVQALAEAIVKLGEDPKLRKRLGDAARSVSESFSEAQVVARWQEVFCD
jgi:glycosyltransferase involved in cell wall biosynthesis